MIIWILDLIFLKLYNNYVVFYHNRNAIKTGCIRFFFLLNMKYKLNIKYCNSNKTHISYHYIKYSSYKSFLLGKGIDKMTIPINEQISVMCLVMPDKTVISYLQQRSNRKCQINVFYIVILLLLHYHGPDDLRYVC